MFVWSKRGSDWNTKWDKSETFSYQISVHFGSQTFSYQISVYFNQGEQEYTIILPYLFPVFFKPDFSTFWLIELKCIEIEYERKKIRTFVIFCGKYAREKSV